MGPTLLFGRCYFSSHTLTLTILSVGGERKGVHVRLQLGLHLEKILFRHSKAKIEQLVVKSF